MRNPLRMLFVALLQLALVLPVCAADLKKGMPFVKARRALLAQHWMPVNTAIRKDHDPLPTEAALIEAKIIEVDFCAMDRALCTFHYQRGKACLRVVTKGEELKDLVIQSWDNECPGKDQAGS